MVYVTFFRFLFNINTIVKIILFSQFRSYIWDKDQKIILDTIACVSDHCGRQEGRRRDANEVGLLQNYQHHPKIKKNFFWYNETFPLSLLSQN